LVSFGKNIYFIQYSAAGENFGDLKALGAISFIWLSLPPLVWLCSGAWEPGQGRHSRGRVACCLDLFGAVARRQTWLFSLYRLALALV